MSIAEKAFKGGIWIGLSKVSIIVLQILQFSILARLLSASEVGLISLLMTVFFLGMGTINAGISNGVIALGSISQKQSSSLFWLNLVAGFLIWGLIYSTAPLICLVFKSGDLLIPLKIFTVIFLLIPFGQQFNYLLQKELNFRSVSMIDIGAALLEVVLCVFLAYKGLKVYSFVYGKIAYFGFSSMIFFLIGLKRWRPIFYFSVADIKPFVSFGLFQLGSNYMYMVYSQMPKFIIAPFLGLDAMGAYELASKITMQPLSKIAPVLKQVAFPVIASVQDDIKKVHKAYKSYLLLLEAAVAPVAMIIGVFAYQIVTLVFGDEWMHIVPLVKILSVAVFVRSLCRVSASVALGLKRADLDFYRVACVAVIAFVAAYPGAKIWGISGVVSAVLLTDFITLMIAYFITIKSLLGITLTRTFKDDYSLILLLVVSICLSFYFSGIIGSIIIALNYFLTYYWYRSKQLKNLMHFFLK